MPNTINELMTMAASALNELDLDRLEDLKHHVLGWMQNDDSLEAQCQMLDAMIQAVANLED
jgi:hypothetical protein